MIFSTAKVRTIIASVVMIGCLSSHLVSSATAKSNTHVVKPPGTNTTPAGKADPGNGSNPTSTSTRPGTGVVTVKHCTTIAICIPNFFNGGQVCQNKVTCP